MKRKFIYLFTAALLMAQTACSQVTEIKSYSGSADLKITDQVEGGVTISIIYDNYIHTEGMKEDWGYACYIGGLEKGILFDTGTNPEIFRHNFEIARLNAEDIDEVFLSHEHLDHTGGLPEVIKMNSNILVAAPETFRSDFFRQVMESGASVASISGPVEICKNLYTTGIIGSTIPEQALVLNTSKGLVVMTGCSHPGLIEMLNKTREIFGKDIYMVFGGFHLMMHNEQQVTEIINAMKGLGVVRCGATHCTGEKQIEMFRQAFGENFVTLGAGNQIIFN